MNILVTGANGFVAGYLIQLLLKENSEVYGIDIQNKSIIENINYESINITDRETLNNYLAKNKINQIYHLAAFSNPSLSNNTPEKALDINVLGFYNILEYARKVKVCRILSIGSQLEYKKKNNDGEYTENDPLESNCIYSASKICSEILGKEYYRQYNCDIVFTRSFNHTGSGQPSNYVISSFAKQIAEISLGLKKPQITVGNIDVMRDIIDVRDVVNAYVKLMKKGISGEVYNVSTGKAEKLKKLLEILIDVSGIQNIDIKKDKSKFRKNDNAIIFGNNDKIRKETDWKQEYSTIETLKSVFYYWKEKIAIEMEN